MITHCKRNSHLVPENAKLPKKESQKGKESKFRPILPKNVANNLIDRRFTNFTNFTNVKKSLNAIPSNLNQDANQSNEIDHFNNINSVNNNNHIDNTGDHLLRPSITQPYSFQNSFLIDTSCQTDDLCQCSSSANYNAETIARKVKSTNTLSVQCPEISTYSSYSNLKFKTKVIHNDKHDYSDSHTQTCDSVFVPKQQECKDQSTSTDLKMLNNDLNEPRSKKSIAIETTLNDLNVNYCFFNDQHDLINHHSLNDQHSQALLVNNPNMNCNASTVQATNKDPLLSTIAVQTDLDYNLNYLSTSEMLKSDQFDFENCLQLNDIQTQTYLNDFNDNTTQTDDFLLDIDIFDS